MNDKHSDSGKQEIRIQMKTDIRRASIDDVFEIHRMVGDIDGIIQHPVHFYHIMIHYFGNTFFIAHEGQKFAGLVWGFVSQTDHDILFLWQIGLLKVYRGKGVSQQLMRTFIKAAIENQCNKVHATVETANIASFRMFEKMGFENISSGELVKENERRAIKNYYGSGTNQILYEYLLESDR